MEQNMNKKPYNKIAAILFAVYTLYQVINFIRVLTFGRFSFETFLFVAAGALITYCLYTEKKDYLLLAGVAALFVLNVYKFLIGFKYQAYHTYDYYTGAKFSIFSCLASLIRVVGFAGAVAVVVAYTTEYLEQYKEYVKKLCLVPSVCIIASTLLSNGRNALANMYGYARTAGVFGVLITIVLTFGIFFMCAWLAYPEGLPQRQVSKSSNGATAVSDAITEPMYYSLITHILLLLFTCGVWLYIWIYRMTRYLNCVEDEEYRNPTNKLLLCMFVPFYSIYWTYKSAIRIDKLAQRKGIQSDLATLCLILSIFVPIIPPILMQDKVNAIVTAGTPVQPVANAQPVTPVQSVANVQPAQPVVDETELLKKYKDLLDTGVITQEEFDAKKKQLLGL